MVLVVEIVLQRVLHSTCASLAVAKLYFALARPEQAREKSAGMPKQNTINEVPFLNDKGTQLDRQLRSEHCHLALKKSIAGILAEPPITYDFIRK